MGSKNLNEKIMECISNPAKSRLMIEIMRRGKVTAKYPVSYTHLDVYKRQEYLLCNQQREWRRRSADSPRVLPSRRKGKPGNRL